jgi:PPOX class probable F420-dependent enzyme
VSKVNAIAILGTGQRLDLRFAPKARHLSDHVGITLIEAGLRRRIARARVGHLATSDGRNPAVVPVCFVLLGETLYHAIDAKPKSTDAHHLRRVANVRANPVAALLVDHYVEDWRRLWYALFRGGARVIEDGPEQQRAIAALKRKYPQYRTTVPLEPDALIIAIDVRRLSYWRASSPGRRRAGRRDPQA